MNKKIITILVGIIALVGVFVFVADRKSETIPTKEVPTQVSEKMSEKIEGWQTYRSEKNGFEIQYPEGWEFDGARHEDPLSFGAEVSPKVWFIDIYDIAFVHTLSKRFIDLEEYVDLLQKDSIEQFSSREGNIGLAESLVTHKIRENRSLGVIDGKKSLIVQSTVHESERESVGIKSYADEWSLLRDWRDASIYIENNEKLYVIRDFNKTDSSYKKFYASLDDDFVLFYESIRFLD